MKSTFLLATAMIVFGSATAHDGQRLIKLECNAKTDSLKVSYFAGWHEAVGDNIWDTFDLKRNYKDKDFVKSLHPVTRRCRLPSGNFKVVIRAVPGNFKLNGHCGGVTFGGVTISLKSKELTRTDFEECMADEIISSVSIKNGILSRESVSRKVFYRF